MTSKITYALLEPGGMTKTSAPLLSMGKGLIGKLLFGAGEKAIPQAARLIGPTGRILEKALPKTPGFMEALKSKQLGQIGKWAKGFFWGKAPTQVLKQRMMQGGVLGKGGILRSMTAMPEELARDVKQFGFMRGLAKNPKSAMGWGAGLAFTAGYPLYGVYSDVSTGNFSHIPKTLISGAAWGVAEPFSMLAQLPVSMAAESAADTAYESGIKKLKSAFTPKPPSLPKIPKPPKLPSAPKLPKISPYSFA